MEQEAKIKASGSAGKTNAAPGRAYKRARQDRGLETRDRLIEAALDVFGRRGFEGASTREIAKAANANLAAIVYHFGSKEALYHAVAAHIVANIRGSVGSALAMVQQQIDHIDATMARAMIAQLLGTFVDVIVGNPQAERWARFMIREQLDPTSAFEIIYGFMGEAHTLITRLVSIAAGGDPESMGTKIKAFTVLGQGLVFRVAQTMVLRRLGRAELGPSERAEIKRVLTENLTAILGGEKHGS